MTISEYSEPGPLPSSSISAETLPWMDRNSSGQDHAVRIEDSSRLGALFRKNSSPPHDCGLVSPFVLASNAK